MSPEQELDLKLAEPERGEVIRLAVSYPGSPKNYTYAVIEAAGLWYLTGVDGGTGRSWDSLINWLKGKNATIVSLRQAASWEDIL